MTPSRNALAAPALGDFTGRQLLRLCEVAELPPADAVSYAKVVTQTLGHVAGQPLDQPPPDLSFLSDDHTPVEFSLSFTVGAAPELRVLLEPGCGEATTELSGRAGLDAVRTMGRRWGFSTRRLDDLEDLFFPPDAQGPLALWCALELRAGGVPKVKVYLNPAAAGRDHAAATVRRALDRLGHQEAYASLPDTGRPLFFALDLGDWDVPRVKVYLAHHDLSAEESAGLSRMSPGPERAGIEEFFRTATGSMPGEDLRLDRRPGQSCHVLTDATTGTPDGFTLYIPVRDYARHDGESLDRAVTLLNRYGMDPGPLHRAVSAVTSRRLEDGVGLIAYLALAHQHGRAPRVTVYLSSEAYAVRPPMTMPVQRTASAH
ncbi:tryptophan dimethylallyltransferase family protein [Streptomyces sp. NPDC005017]|uniref:tryptophan dimethylallyltransferase family protein n=1 Tax=Streptomyces sp. NPDC005017 TaxID=3364706 RepID=UPI0036BBAA08